MFLRSEVSALVASKKIQEQNTLRESSTWGKREEHGPASLLKVNSTTLSWVFPKLHEMFFQYKF